MKIAHKSNKARYIICIMFVNIIFGGFFWRLIDWQIINGEFYRRKASFNHIYTIETKAVRGEIVDINGEPLVKNDVGYRIVFDPFNIDEAHINEVILSLIALFEKKGEKWEDILPILLDKNGSFTFTNDKFEDNDKRISHLKSILKLNSTATAIECMQKLKEQYKCENLSAQQALNVVSVRYNMQKSGYYDYTPKSYTFADNLSQEIIAIISENSQLYLGVNIAPSTQRKLSDGSLAPHIIGNVGALSMEDYDELKDKGYRLDDKIGKTGIEKRMESYLRGKDGKKMIETTKNGEIVAQLENQETFPGNTIFLTINSKLQKTLNESLEKNIKAANTLAKDCIAGAAVVLNVKDFSILAASTYPSYDAIQYLSDKNYYKEITNDEKTKPLMNRAFDFIFPPGSTFKPIVACAALQENAISNDSSITCGHAWHPPDAPNWPIKCMGNHGNIRFPMAMAKSCNSFFAETGYRLGIDRLNSYASKFGLGVKTGIELYETEGVLANKSLVKNERRNWGGRDIGAAALGQSYNAFSPLQLATYTATIARDGERYKTHLVRKVTNYSRDKVIFENDPENPELIETAGISKTNMEYVKKAMRSVASTGTARGMFANYPVPIAAKTGTAQNSGTDHSTFICFAPYDKPEIALAIVLEHGSPTHHRAFTLDVAKDILDAYFAKNGKTN
ncbi:MAG: penicillin-binding protein [Oscillospiraceae bacterium]|jgi:penicillin-binding protein 2|nr:penicillin-binding protein [Oscillospiraceae bacterium]